MLVKMLNGKMDSNNAGTINWNPAETIWRKKYDIVITLECILILCSNFVSIKTLGQLFSFKVSARFTKAADFLRKTMLEKAN